MSSNVDWMPKGLAKPAQRALAAAGLRNLKELSKWTEGQVMALHGMGPRAMETLKEAMKEKGVVFARGWLSRALRERDSRLGDGRRTGRG